MRRRKQSKPGSVSIRAWLAGLTPILLVFGGAFTLYWFKGRGINVQDVQSSEKIIGLSLTAGERRMLLGSLRDNRRSYDTLHGILIPNDVPPAFQFNPRTAGVEVEAAEYAHRVQPYPSIRRPQNLDELAFWSLPALASLLRSGQITSTELTRFFIDRLKRYGPRLECVVTLTEELALSQARRADEELARGIDRGPLHGIPWGAKDLLSVKGYPTTWGAMPYKNRIIEEDATVVRRLEEAGAVLVAKLTLGALAMGDVWYGGKTRSPWHPEKGSSGSSAGPAAATAAGLVAFSIGSETWGSIVSPSTRCGLSGLRPTFGRVSRHGAMALSWTMDKIGPIGRSVEDCALVFSAICGPDGKDLTVVDQPFDWDPELALDGIRVGYLSKAFEGKEADGKNDRAVLDVLRSLGIELIPIELPDLPVRSISFILDAEAAAAFDDLTRGNRDDLLVEQEKDAWPNIFRQARFIPAVEYIQANRLRTLYMKEMSERMEGIEVFVAPAFGQDTLLATNLTGHPAVVVPNGPPDAERLSSITFIGGLFKEAEMLRVAKAYQDATGFHLQHPDLDRTLEGKNE